MRGRRLRWVAVSLVAVASLVSCSDPVPAAKAPRRLPTPTATATSASPSPSPSTPEQEVEAAVRTYYAELNRAIQTNDTSKLKKLVHKGCPCYNAIKIIDSNRAEGERTPTAKFTLTEVRAHDVIGKSAAAEVRYDVSAYDVLGASGEVKERVNAERSHLDLSLIKFESVWTVTNLFDMESGP